MDNQKPQTNHHSFLNPIKTPIPSPKPLVLAKELEQSLIPPKQISTLQFAHIASAQNPSMTQSQLKPKIHPIATVDTNAMKPPPPSYTIETAPKQHPLQAIPTRFLVPGSAGYSTTDFQYLPTNIGWAAMAAGMKYGMVQHPTIPLGYFPGMVPQGGNPTFSPRVGRKGTSGIVDQSNKNGGLARLQAATQMLFQEAGRNSDTREEGATGNDLTPSVPESSFQHISTTSSSSIDSSANAFWPDAKLGDKQDSTRDKLSQARERSKQETPLVDASSVPYIQAPIRQASLAAFDHSQLDIMHDPMMANATVTNPMMQAGMMQACMMQTGMMQAGMMQARTMQARMMQAGTTQAGMHMVPYFDPRLAGAAYGMNSAYNANPGLPVGSIYCAATGINIAKKSHPKVKVKLCRMERCMALAAKRTPYCVAHSGDRKCEYPKCGKYAQGRTRYCIGHGGGRRCTVQGCTKGARDKLFCAGHGGGKRCEVEGCTRSAVGGCRKCTGHGGGRRCQFVGCTKSAQSCTPFCVRHGGGKKCVMPNCEKVARGKTSMCMSHNVLKKKVETGEITDPTIVSTITGALAATALKVKGADATAATRNSFTL